jgi:glycosyltransferase involved in cell wall biosynthesis
MSVKLIIQIPCYNEADTLPATLRDLPTEVPGVDQLETLVVSDGSTDSTLQVARDHGVDHIVDLPINKGLAHAWSVGLEAALRAGADIIVNTDGDNQYCGADVPKLVRPILEKEAEIVVGARPIESIGHFSWLKKRLQRLGSWVVSRCAGIAVDDAASGFRAYSAQAARDLNLLSGYSHCAETLIRAARRGLKVRNVPIRVNEKLRESRLMSSLPAYLWRQARDISRIAIMVHPLKVFAIPAVLFFLIGSAGCIRFLVFYFSGDGAGHVQSLIFSAIFIMVAFILGMMGLTADMISSNHQLIEDTLVRIKRLEEDNGRGPFGSERKKGQSSSVADGDGGG